MRKRLADLLTELTCWSYTRQFDKTLDGVVLLIVERTPSSVRIKLKSMGEDNVERDQPEERCL